MKRNQKLIGAVLILLGASISCFGQLGVSADISDGTAGRLAIVYLVAGILVAMAGVATLALAYIKS